MEQHVTKEFRCGCGKLLFKGVLIGSSVEIKCLRCGKINEFDTFGLDNDSSYTILFDSDGAIIEASKSIENVLGHNPQDLIGKDISYVSAMPESALRDVFQRIKAHKGAYRLVSHHKNTHGELIPVSVSIRYMEEPSGSKFFAIYTVLKSTDDQAPIAPEDFLNVCDIITDFDVEAICTYMSPEIVKFTGFEAEDYVGRSMLEFTPEDFQPTAMAELKKYAPLQKAFIYKKNQTLAKDGKTLFLESYFLPKYNDAGVFCGYTVMSCFKKSTKSSQASKV